MRSGLAKCEIKPVRRVYSVSATASGGRSTAVFGVMMVLPARSWPINYASCAGSGPVGVGSNPSTADEDRTIVIVEFTKCAIEPQKLPKHNLRRLNFDLDPLDENVRKSRRKVGEHSFEGNKLLGRNTAKCRNPGLR
jgi:hypothetical protein